MFKNTFIFLLIVGLFVETSTVFAEDKNLADSENFHIKVIIENERIVKKEVISKKDLEEGHDIELSEDDEEFSIVTIDTDSTVSVSEYEQILNAYKKWNFEILLDSEFESINVGDKLLTNIKISTVSQKEIDLSKYVVDSYLVVRDKDGNIIGKQDLWDITRSIDFLGLLNGGNIYKVFDLLLKHNFFVSLIPGEYSVELTIVFSAGFLDLDKSITDKYQIEVRSNRLNVVIKESSEKCLKKGHENEIFQSELIYILIFVVMILIWWILVILTKVLSYFLIGKYKK